MAESGFHIMRYTFDLRNSIHYIYVTIQPNFPL